MAQTIHLNGGPWHDRVVAIEDGLDHVHVMEAVPDAIRRAILDETMQEGFNVVPLKEGTYSRVSGPQYRNEFEWDGWLSHD